jgi:26S proteasome regulatory subunit N1
MLESSKPVTLNEKKQMAWILARHKSHITLEDPTLDALIGNVSLSEQYLEVARAMDLARVKAPDELIGSTSIAARRNQAAANNPLSALLGLNNNNNSNSNSHAATESARGNLAQNLINGFINAGHNSDAFFNNPSAQQPSSSSAASASSTNTSTNAVGDWLSRNRGIGMTVAAASVGLTSMWNFEEAINRLDPLMNHENMVVKVGAVLGIGIASNSVRDEADAAFALLSDYLMDEKYNTLDCRPLREAAILGLGIAYANARKVEVQEVLESIVGETEDARITESSLAAFALGLVFAGTANDEIGSTILQRLMEASTMELDENISKLLCLGLGLLYLGKGEQCDGFKEALQTIEHRRGKYAVMILECCAFAGSGNVLKVQDMLRVCAEHGTTQPVTAAAANAAPAAAGPGGGAASLLAALTGGGAPAARGGANGAAAGATGADTTGTANTPENIALAEHQAIAVLGIALVAMGEDTGSEMTLRSFDHLLQYGDIAVKRVVPLALALLHLSSPEYSVVDQLSRLSHDSDVELATNAIVSLGLISAGTNNSRVNNLLKSLAEYYSKDSYAGSSTANNNQTFLLAIRFAQALNGMGKGLVGISVFHSDRLLLHAPALGAVMFILLLLIDKQKYLFPTTDLNNKLNITHWLFALAPALQPRYVTTLAVKEDDPETTERVTVNVRVGLAVETVGQAGRPKTITGFQTHSTPVLLGVKERAEIANREWKSISNVMEGVVLLEKVEDKEASTTTSTTNNQTIST